MCIWQNIRNKNHNFKLQITTEYISTQIVPTETENQGSVENAKAMEGSQQDEMSRAQHVTPVTMTNLTSSIKTDDFPVGIMII